MKWASAIEHKFDPVQETWRESGALHVKVLNIGKRFLKTRAKSPKSLLQTKSLSTVRSTERSRTFTNAMDAYCNVRYRYFRDTGISAARRHANISDHGRGPCRIISWRWENWRRNRGSKEFGSKLLRRRTETLESCAWVVKGPIKRPETTLTPSRFGNLPPIAHRCSEEVREKDNDFTFRRGVNSFRRECDWNISPNTQIRERCEKLLNKLNDKTHPVALFEWI